jgi:hypothetical protein
MSEHYLHSLTSRVTQLERMVEYNTIHRTLGSVAEEASCVNVHKDIVARHHIVASLCEPNKIVMTNEHKQLQSLNINSVITGTENQIYVTTNPNGIASVRCPQDINTTSSPTFQSIYVTKTPSTDNEVTNKAYVDSAVANSSKVDLNLCKRLDIINPDGACMRIGRDGGTFVDVNVDANGTLNLSSTENSTTTNDIDIFGERINFLSNINTTSPLTGSLVVYGGVGIVKDLHLGGGIYLRTDEGIPSKLDFFEEGALPIMWTGIWSTQIDSEFVYQRIGGKVTLMFPYVACMSNVSDVITNTQSTYLPSTLRPIYDIKEKKNVIDNNTEMSGYISIFGNDGRITVKPEAQPKFTGTGISGFGTICISYMVDVKNKSDIIS